MKQRYSASVDSYWGVESADYLMNNFVKSQYPVSNTSYFKIISLFHMVAMKVILSGQGCVIDSCFTGA